MESNMIFMLSTITVLLCSFSNAQAIGSPSPSPSPTPAPAPAPAPTTDFVNLKYLLTVAGPFHTFLKYIESAHLLKTFQTQANNTQQGITIFVPKDKAFSALEKPSLSNLTHQQLKSLLLFHALPKFYTLAEFENLSETNPVTTFGGGIYNLNFTYTMGTVNIDSGWTKTKITSSVHSTDPVAVYQIDKVLLPEAIYGTAPPPPPAPAPSPNNADPYDMPPMGQLHTDESSSNYPNPSPYYRIISWSSLAISGVVILFM